MKAQVQEAKIVKNTQALKKQLEENRDRVKRLQNRGRLPKRIGVHINIEGEFFFYDNHPLRNAFDVKADSLSQCIDKAVLIYNKKEKS